MRSFAMEAKAASLFAPTRGTRFPRYRHGDRYGLPSRLSMTHFRSDVAADGLGGMTFFQRHFLPPVMMARVLP
jgi:hypothetical protein